MIVEMFTRPGCHLCEIAKEFIREATAHHPIQYIERNVEEDPAWEREFGHDLPVVLIDGRKAFKHRIDPAAFMRYLRRSAR